MIKYTELTKEQKIEVVNKLITIFEKKLIQYEGVGDNMYICNQASNLFKVVMGWDICSNITEEILQTLFPELYDMIFITGKICGDKTKTKVSFYWGRSWSIPSDSNPVQFKLSQLKLFKLTLTS